MSLSKYTNFISSIKKKGRIFRSVLSQYFESLSMENSLPGCGNGRYHLLDGRLPDRGNLPVHGGGTVPFREYSRYVFRVPGFHQEIRVINLLLLPVILGLVGHGLEPNGFLVLAQILERDHLLDLGTGYGGDEMVSPSHNAHLTDQEGFHVGERHPVN